MIKLKVGIMVFGLSLLAACTTPKVYIINQGVEDDRVSALVTQLTLQGHKVERSDALVPDEFDNVAIASNPSLTDPDVFLPIEQTLQNLGWGSPSYYKFAQGNHYYHGRNIGIYLRNPNVRQMPPIMGTRGCKTFSATIEYFRDNKAIFEYELFDEASQDYIEILLRGTYRANGDSLSLRFKNTPEIQLRIFSDMVETHVGMRHADYINLPLEHFIDSAEVCRLDAVYE